MRRKFHSIIAVVLAAVLICGSFGVQTAFAETGETAPVQWKEVNKYFYCYQGGQKLTGVREINGNTYYFKSNGAQLTGWRKVGSDYCFFRIVNGAGGYMVKNQKVNGIKLNADGKAVLNTKRAKRKTKLMAKCATLMDKATKPGQTKAKKLKAAFNVAKKKYPRKNIHRWKKSKDWDIYYAEYIVRHRTGDCYCQGALMAYLANAVGYTNVKAISSGHHGWAMVNGKVYDPNWSFIIGNKKCYAVKKSLSGRGGRPKWFEAATYKKDLRK